MEGCSSMSPWTNIYRQAGLETPRPISSILMDPIQQHPQERGELISWCDGVQNDIMSPLIGLNNNTIRSDPFDATSSSIEHSLECLLSGTNSNTETTSSDNYDEDNYNNNNSNSNNNNNNLSEKFWNFSSNNNNQNNAVLPKKRNNIISTTTPKCTKRQRSCNTTSTTKKWNNNNYSSNNISFQQGNANSSVSSMDEADAEAIQQMKEMIYRAAAFRPVDFGVDHQIDRPKRRNVRISNDPQTAAARQRRERISERLRVLQKLVPGGSKMDTASMLDEAANYLKFLRNQVRDLENFGNKFHQFHPNHGVNHGFNHPSSNLQFSPPMAFSMQNRPS